MAERKNNFGRDFHGSRKEDWDRGNLGINANDKDEQKKRKQLKRSDIWSGNERRKIYMDVAEKAGIEAAYMVSQAYNTIPTHLAIASGSRTFISNDDVNRYVDYIEEMKNCAKNINEYSDIYKLRQTMIDKIGEEGFLNYNLVKAVNRFDYIEKQDLFVLIKHDGFLASKDENRLKNACIIDMDKAEYKGENRSGIHVYYVREILKDDGTSSKDADMQYSMTKKYDPQNDKRFVVFKRTGEKYKSIGKADTYEEAKQLYLDSTKRKTGTYAKYQKIDKIERLGMPNVRHGMNITPERLQREFGIAFNRGNTLTDKETQKHLNNLYDACSDLAKVLGIDKKDIGLNGLGISVGGFGKGGRGGVIAHFDPGKNLINITRANGAGSLAHEWFHALDCYIGKQSGQGITYSSSIPNSKTSELANMLKRNEDGKGSSKYYSNSVQPEHGKKLYWSTGREMLARAFSCYVQDKIDGKSDYLCGHSDTCHYGKLPLFPQGEERARFDKEFDKFIDYTKERGILHSFDYESKEKTHEKNISKNNEVKKFHGAKQLSFDDFFK